MKNVKTKIELREKNTPNGVFYYKDFGKEEHGRSSFRLWISKVLVQKDEEGSLFVNLPAPARVKKTEKGNLVLKKDEDYRTYMILVPCGYRGSSRIIPASDEAECYYYKYFESGRGALGISEGALISVPKNSPLVFEWRRSGRLYGDPDRGVTTITPDGAMEVVEDVSLDELKELEVK